ncbi:MAG: arylesterase [Pseudomonadota bacterium]
MKRLFNIESSWLLALGLVSALFCASASADSSGAAPGPVLVLGDSLGAAYNLPLGSGWVDLLEQTLTECQVGVVNASISGDTSAGGLARLPDLLETYQPSIVLVELGGNDGLRGLPTSKLYENLREIAVKSERTGARVVLAGMQIPGNYGARYRQAFSDVYPELAAELEIALIPFLLEGVALQPGMIQGDGIHPTGAAQPVILENVLPYVSSQLDSCAVGEAKKAGMTAQ